MTHVRAGFMPEGMPPDAVKVIAPIMEKVCVCVITRITFQH